MKLTYRGIAYEYNPPKIEVPEGKIAGKYRGQDWRFRNLKKPPVLQPSYNLTYRGVKYCNQPVAGVEQNERVETPVSVLEKARILMLERERETLKREQSMFGRLADEVGLPLNRSTSYTNA